MPPSSSFVCSRCWTGATPPRLKRSAMNVASRRPLTLRARSRGWAMRDRHLESAVHAHLMPEAALVRDTRARRESLQARAPHARRALADARPMSSAQSGDACDAFRGRGSSSRRARARRADARCTSASSTTANPASGRVIVLTRLNGQPVMLNCDLIESVERNGETIITLTTGNVVVVREAMDEIERQRRRLQAQASNRAETPMPRGVLDGLRRKARDRRAGARRALPAGAQAAITRHLRAAAVRCVSVTRVDDALAARRALRRVGTLRSRYFLIGSARRRRSRCARSTARAELTEAMRRQGQMRAR